MATPSAPQKSTVAAAVQSALPLPAAAAPTADAPEKNDLVLLAPTPELNPRNRIAKEIAERANRDADIAAAETQPVTDDDGSPVEPAATVATVAPETPIAPETRQGEQMPAAIPAVDPEAPVSVEVAAPIPPSFDPNAEYDMVVDGKPIKVKGSQIIERGKLAISKETAADYKLELAAKLLAEAEAQRKAVPAAQTPPVTTNAPTDAQLAQAIQFGTAEQAEFAVRELKKRAGPEVTPDSIKQLMVQTMPQVVQDQLAFQEGVSFVKTEYADLLADPYLNPLFAMKENQLRQAGDKRPYRELYKAIGEDIRTHFNRPKATVAAPAPAAKTMEQKVAAKAAAPAAPKLASARMESAPEARPKTREEIIAAMQRARGQGAPRTIQ